MGDGEHYNEGACLRAERIVFETRKLDGVRVFQMTGNHKGTKGKLLINSYAVIDRQFKTVPRTPPASR
jgi:hypothetical protein